MTLAIDLFCWLLSIQTKTSHAFAILSPAFLSIAIAASFRNCYSNENVFFAFSLRQTHFRINSVSAQHSTYCLIQCQFNLFSSYRRCNGQFTYFVSTFSREQCSPFTVRRSPLRFLFADFFAFFCKTDSNASNVWNFHFHSRHFILLLICSDIDWSEGKQTNGGKNAKKKMLQQNSVCLCHMISHHINNDCVPVTTPWLMCVRNVYNIWQIREEEKKKKNSYTIQMKIWYLTAQIFFASSLYSRTTS